MPSIHYVLYIPSAIQASTHMPTHCTAPWVGGSTASPSPLTAGPVGKGQKVCPTREEPCSHMRREVGSVANSLRLQSWITSAHNVNAQVSCTAALYPYIAYCQWHTYHHIQHIQSHSISCEQSAVWRGPADRAALPVAN